MFEILILVITLLANRLNLNSTNSNKPLSTDPNRKKKPKPKTSRNKGGQKGHVGTTLKKVDDPDIIDLFQGGAHMALLAAFVSAGFGLWLLLPVWISRWRFAAVCAI